MDVAVPVEVRHGQRREQFSHVVLADIVLFNNVQHQLQGVQRPSHISGSRVRDELQCAVGEADVLPEFLRPLFEPRDRLVRRDMLELKNGASRQQSVVDVIIRIFRCGSDESDGPVLDVLQKRLLLLLVEILYFVEIEQHSALAHDRTGGGRYLLYVGESRGGRVEEKDLLAGFRGENGRRGRLSGAWRSEEDHGRQNAVLHQFSQNAVLSHKFFLTDHFVKIFRTEQVGGGSEFRAHRITSVYG